MRMASTSAGIWALQPITSDAGYMKGGFIVYQLVA